MFVLTNLCSGMHVLDISESDLRQNLKLKLRLIFIGSLFLLVNIIYVYQNHDIFKR
jgi:hypothetical protein